MLLITEIIINQFKPLISHVKNKQGQNSLTRVWITVSSQAGAASSYQHSISAFRFGGVGAPRPNLYGLLEGNPVIITLAAQCILQFICIVWLNTTLFILNCIYRSIYCIHLLIDGSNLFVMLPPWHLVLLWAAAARTHDEKSWIAGQSNATRNSWCWLLLLPRGYRLSMGVLECGAK